MSAIVPYLLPLGIVIIANWGVRLRPWKILTHLCLGLLNSCTLLLGLMFVATPIIYRVIRQPMPPELQAINPLGLGWVFVVGALLGWLCLITPLRRLLARVLPLEPASPVHSVALTFFVYLAATSLGPLLTSQSFIFSLVDSTRLSAGLLVSEQALFVVFALAGVGLFVRRNPRETAERLGLRVPKLRHLAIALAAVIALLAFDYGVSLVWRQFWPASYELVSQSSGQLFGRFSTVLGALLLGLSAGTGEEMLFRGALQPRFRIPLTAALFAVSHLQYGVSPAMVEILIVGLVLGWIRERCNTTTCMVVHTAYNTLNVLLMPLLP